MLTDGKELGRGRYATKSFSKTWLKVFSKGTIPFLSALRSAIIKGAAGKPDKNARLSFNLAKYLDKHIIVFRFLHYLEFSNMIIWIRYISKDKITFRIHYCFGPPVKPGSEETSNILKGRPAVFGESSFNAYYAVNLKEQDPKKAAALLFEVMLRKISNAKSPFCV